MRINGFLLDAHVPLAVVTGVQQVRPDARIEHLARWRGGVFRQAGDEVILSEAEAEGLVFVSYDLATVPAILHERLYRAEALPPVALISARGGTAPSIGSVIHLVVQLYDDPSVFDPDYPFVYLQAD